MLALRDDLQITAATSLPTRYGTFQMESFRDRESGERSCVEPHLALSTGLEKAARPLVRVHSECITAEVFASERCDCGRQLHEAMRLIAKSGCGLVIYLRQEGRGIGIENKLQAYALQELGMDTIDSNLALGLPVDCRSYDPAIRYLRHRRIDACDLLTNNPDKETALRKEGFDVSRVSLICQGGAAAQDYLSTKRQRMGHDC
jgi:GTP cyclohydrolase II